VSQGDVELRIAGLAVHPVKSCAGIALQEALLIETGLEFDRAWMVVDEAGRFVSQRELPQMALVKPTLRQLDMILRAPGMLALHIALDVVEKPVRVTVWDDEVAAYDMGDLAAQWFSDFLGRKLRFVRFDPEHRRLSNRRWTGHAVGDTLAGYRADARLDGALTFGMNAIILEGIERTLRVGMSGTATYRFE
jgi:uncharacterized protein YcbX